jgi:hypothetical protein
MTPFFVLHPEIYSGFQKLSKFLDTQPACAFALPHFFGERIKEKRILISKKNEIYYF